MPSPPLSFSHDLSKGRFKSTRQVDELSSRCRHGPEIQGGPIDWNGVRFKESMGATTSFKAPRIDGGLAGPGAQS